MITMRLSGLLILAVPAASMPLGQDTPQIPMGVSPTTKTSLQAPDAFAPSTYDDPKQLLLPSRPLAVPATVDDVKEFLFPSKPLDVPSRQHTPSATESSDATPEEDETAQLEASERARRWNGRDIAGLRLGQVLALKSECFCAGGSICCRDATAEDGINCTMGPCGL